MADNDSINVPKFSLKKRYQQFRLSLSPQQNLLLGFLTYTFLGCFLLSIPIFHKQFVPLVDNLFIATSAISTTGLVTVSIFDNYNIGGQFIILLLIQLGGIGYMTFTTFILLSRTGNLTHWHERILNAEFSMPKGFNIKDFLRSVIIFTILIESLGALFLYIAFIEAGIEHNFALWSSVFHSVSAFCTAGFSLYNNSFEQFSNNISINLILSFLAICGSLGFIVVTDFWNQITKRTKLTLTTKIILSVLILLLSITTIILFLFEPSLNHLSTKDKLLVSFFQVMTALTTVGFNTIPINNFMLPTLLIIVFLMFVGASPSGTGGGMKSTTLTALWAVMWSRINGKEKITFLGSAIPLERIFVATSTFILYSTILFIATFLLSITEKLPLNDILFEVTSAIGTVGLSTGITNSLSFTGKLILVFVMFVGRLGVLTFGLAILSKQKKSTTFIITNIEDETDIAV